MTRAATLFVLLFAGLWWTAAADEPSAPSLVEPLPFDHAEHARALERTGLGCVGCHPVGLRMDAGSEAPPLPSPPLSACHGCHAGEVSGAGRGAPTSCLLCHDDRLALRPLDHGPDWMELHDTAARTSGSTCEDCHSAATCLDCHDRRGAGSANPHPVGFQRFHGVEARLDPRSCSTCHTEASCVTCHTTGSTPW
jgi:hypothetical protein